MGEHIEEYNIRRLYSSIDYTRPVDYYKGNPKEIKRLKEEKLAIVKKVGWL